MLSEQRWQQRTFKEFRLLKAVVALIVIATHVFASPGFCAEQVEHQTRRMFVPAKHPERWPAGDWVPIRPQRLEAILKSAGSALTTPDRFLFASAIYEATFNPQSNLLEAGSANLTRADSDSGFVLFEPCSLALSEPEWTDGSTVTDKDRRAILGTDLAGSKQLVTPLNARNLHFNWSLRGRERLTGVDFDIDVPKAVVTGFQLSVPDGWLVSSNTGVAYAGVDSGLVPPPGDTTSTGFTTWRVDLGHAHRCRIRLHEPGATESQDHAGIAAYRLNSRSLLRSEWLEQLFEFTFDALPTGVDELTIAIPPELIVSSIEDGSGRAFSWRDTGPLPDKWHALRVQISGTSEDDPQRIVMRGSQPLSSPSEQIRLRLESPRPDNAVLLGGNVSPLSVVVEFPFQIARYSSQGLRQTATSVDQDRHELAFEQYSSQAYVDLHIHNFDKQSLRKLSVREYSVLDAGTTPQQLAVVLELTSQSQGLFASSWLVPLEWELTAVSLATSTATSSSETDNLSWSVARVSDKYQRLVIDLADGLPVRKPLRLHVTAQRADQSVDAEILVPVLLPEIARSVSVVFGINGCEDPHQPQIVSEAYHRHSDAESLIGPDWEALVAGQKTLPDAVWTTNYWTLTDDIRAATLLLPNGVSNSEGLTSASDSPLPVGTVDAVPSVESDGNIERQQAADAPGAETRTPATATDPVQSENSRSSQLVQPTIVNAKFDSQLSPGTVSRDLHRFTWKFHYPSESSPFRFRLPLTSELLAVTWRGHKVAPIQEGEEWFVPLALVDAEDELSVDYTLPSQDVYLRETYRCRIPTADVTVVRFDWQVRLRNRYSVVSFAAELTPDEAERPGFWLSWCFGPLARSDASTLFNPFRSDSWTRLLQGRGDGKVGGTGNFKAAWKTFSASTSGLPESLTVHICDNSRLHALSWFVLTLSSLIGVLLRSVVVPHRSRFALVWLSGCVASMTIIPGAYAELVGAAALGSILATLVPRTLVRPFRQKSPDAAQVSMASTITRRIVTATVVIVATCLAVSARAQQSEPVLATEIDVLIPYSNSPFETEPESVFVFVRSLDLQTLTNSLLNERVPSPQTLLTKSQWAVNVAEPGRAEIVATIVAAVHNEDAFELELPIAARFLTGQSACTVNGTPVSVLPSADGSRLRIPLPLKSDVTQQPGLVGRPLPPPLPEPTDIWREYTVELHLRPLTQRTPESSHISMPVPAIPDARVSLSFDRRPEAAFAGDLTAPIPVTSEGTAELAMGPVDELTIGWRQAASGRRLVAADVSTQPSVDLRSSIDVHPNWMERRTHARYLVTGQTVRYIEWKLPALCQVDLDQFRIRNLVDKALRRVGDHNVLTCEFDPPMTETFEFEIRWRQLQPDTKQVAAVAWAVPMAPGLGNVPLRVGSHLAGLSPEAGFQLSKELQELSTASGVDGSVLVNTWPENDRPRIPEMAFRVLDTTVLIPNISPLQSQRTTRLSQVARIQPFGIQWTVSAEVDTAVVAAFTHEFLLDDQFRIDTVTVLEDDVDRLSHWEHEDGRLFLHLRNRRSGVQNITLTGQQRIKGDGIVVVPRFESVVGTNAESTLLIYRSRNLRVAVTGAESINENSVASSETPTDEPFVGRFRVRAGQNTRLQIDSIPVEPSAWIFAEAASDDPGEIQVAVTIHLHAMTRRNVQIELPDWASVGTPTVNVADASAVVSQDRKSVVVMLPRPIPQQVAVTLKASINLRDESSFSLVHPKIRGIKLQNAVLTFAEGMDEWELLPGEPLSDSVRNRLIEFEPRLASESGTFVTWSEATRLSQLSTLPGVENLPPLVFHLVRPGIRRSGVSTTRILLRTDLAHISLTWPQDAQLVSVRIDGRIENIFPAIDGILRLPLAGRGSVHDVEILWSPSPDTAAMKIQRRSISIPQLLDLGPVEAFVIASPGRRVNLISTGESPRPDIQTAIGVLSRWTESIRRSRSLATRIEAVQWMQNALSSVTDESKSAVDIPGLTWLQSGPTETVLNTASDQPRTNMGSDLTDGYATPIVQAVDGSDIRLWVVDNRVNGVLASILIAIVVLPIFVLFLKLETGDRIARRPELCWLVLGMIWWLCLKGSGAGFVLGLMAGLWIAGSYIVASRSKTALPGNS